MTQGAVIFAYNTDLYEYTRIATVAARRIQHYLDIPVTLVTDSDSVTDSVFDHVIIQDNDREQARFRGTELEQWRNFDRHLAWDLSPYDRTLLVDADFIVASDSLKSIMDSDLEFACHRNQMMITGEHFHRREAFGNHQIPTLWATVVAFDRSRFSETVFSRWKQIQEHYQYYAQLHRFISAPYRNDYALSMALHQASGQLGEESSSASWIPWDLVTVGSDTDIVLNQGTYSMTYTRINNNLVRKFKLDLRDHDLHIANKIWLMNNLEALNV